MRGERNDEARREMLAAIRERLAASAPFDCVRGERHAQHESERRASRVTARTEELTVQPTEARAMALVGEFRAALEAVAGRCVFVSDEEQAVLALRQTIAESNITRTIVEQGRTLRVAVSDSSLARGVVERARLSAEVLEDAAPSQLFSCDIGITGAQWAVAETGTLVLESDAERHRLASLVPPVHVAIINADCLRRTLGEVLQMMSEKGRDNLSRAVTFITGSSRTSDIELTLALGVHGPAELHVIVIGGEAP